MPSKIITDYGSNLNNNMVEALCKDLKIVHHNSSPYRPKMNGVVEAAKQKNFYLNGDVLYKRNFDMVDLDYPLFRCI